MDEGMPRWMRARSAFGASGIDLEDLEETPDGIVARVEMLSKPMANPCLPSLLWARLLLEPASSYRVYEASATPETVRVSGADLDAAMPVWDEARRRFVSGLFPLLPLSTFLPANLAARRQHETDRNAAQAAAWIAIDDALDAIVESILVPQQRSQERLEARLGLVILELDASGADAEPTLALARDSTRDVADEVSALSGPIAHGFLERTERGRKPHQLRPAWGPVARLLGVR